MVISAVTGLIYEQSKGRRNLKQCYIATWKEGSVKCTVRVVDVQYLQDFSEIINAKYIDDKLVFAGGVKQYPKEVRVGKAVIAKVDYTKQTVLRILVSNGEIIGVVATDVTGRVYIYRDVPIKRLVVKQSFTNIKNRLGDSGYDYLHFKVPVGLVDLSAENKEKSLIKTKEFIAEKIVTVKEGMNVRLIEWIDKKSVTISVPEYITELTKGAFRGCSVATGINLGGIKEIEYSDIAPLKGLQSLIGNEVAEVCTDAFRENRNLRIVNLPKLKIVKSELFKDMECLGSVNIPSAERIGEGAFEGCISLSVLDTDKLKYIGENAFRGCVLLKRVNGIVRKVGKKAFKDSGLEVFSGTKVLTELGDEAFANSNLRALNLKTTPYVLGKNVCKGCLELKAVDIPSIVRKNETMFIGCTKLGKRAFRCSI